jgi:hypothetical protein
LQENATSWRIGENSNGEQTLVDTLVWMEKAGHVSPFHIGRLARSKQISD